MRLRTRGFVIQRFEGMDEMSIDIMGLDTELAYRRDRLPRRGEADRQAHVASGPRPLDRLVPGFGDVAGVVQSAARAELHASAVGGAVTIVGGL